MSRYRVHQIATWGLRPRSNDQTVEINITASKTKKKLPMKMIAMTSRLHLINLTPSELMQRPQLQKIASWQIRQGLLISR
jgi:hypothetical protein